MSKVIAASMVFVLAISTGVFATTTAEILQGQVTNIAVTNSIDLLHGSQMAGSLQNLVVDNSQCIDGICSTAAHEGLFATVGQTANAYGQCALIGVAQSLGILGTQQQEVTQGVGPKAQTQGLEMLATQALGRGDGEGNANAVHILVAAADQSAGNPAGDMHESSNIIGMQTSTVDGQAGSTSLVNSSMHVQTQQTQGAL
jgi:hypothetical protein